MKQNLIRYLKEYRDRSFREAPFSEADALLLSALSYMKLDGLVPGFSRRGSISLRELNRRPDGKHLFADPLYGQNYRKIMALIADSRRYGSIRLQYFVSWTDEAAETQFAAVTFRLGRTSAFLSFRGTDETLVGWKEDFNMAFMEAVPAQRRALAYLKGVSRYLRQELGEKNPGEGECALMLGGHSKGGSLALYAAACADFAIQSQIRRIYSFDGPGLQKRFYEKPGFLRIQDRFCKIVPEQSVIGLLLSREQKYRVVESYGSSTLKQHDLMQWKIENGRFRYCRKLGRRGSRKSQILNLWISSLSRKQIAEFVGLLYRLVLSVRLPDVSAVLEMPVRVLFLLLRELLAQDSASRKLVRQILRKLLEAAAQVLTGRAGVQKNAEQRVRNVCGKQKSADRRN